MRALNHCTIAPVLHQVGICVTKRLESVPRYPDDIQDVVKTKIIERCTYKWRVSRDGRVPDGGFGLEVGLATELGFDVETQANVQFGGRDAGVNSFIGRNSNYEIQTETILGYTCISSGGLCVSMEGV